jgi:hypothetical protein
LEHHKGSKNLASWSKKRDQLQSVTTTAKPSPTDCSCHFRFGSQGTKKQQWRQSPRKLNALCDVYTYTRLHGGTSKKTTTYTPRHGLDC